MKRIKVIITILSVLLVSHSTMAQNPPSMDVMPNDSLIVNSGINYLIIPNVNDGDDTNQEITFDVTSSDLSLLEIDSVTYNSNENLAVIFMKEKGIEGDLSLSVTATDTDGSTSQDFLINIGLYKKGGLHFQIHDAVFWKRVIPLNTSPVFDTIIHTSSAPYNELNWDNVPITVNADCVAEICTGHDFFTAMLRGYVVPSTDGDYSFYLKIGAKGGLWLSADENINNAVPIILNTDEAIGTPVDGMILSDPVNLKAGKRYAIYAINWVVHGTITDIYWEGPGITKTIIGKENLMYEYDPVWPTAPENLQVSLKAVNKLNITWNKASDNVKLAGYNVYVDGIKINDLLIEETNYSIENLSAATNYTIAVSSIDNMGNESFLSDFLIAETYSDDIQNPTPPTEILLDVNSGLAAQISWSGAADSETEVIAYNVYLDGVLFNTEGLVYESNITLKVLSPETSYDVEIEAIDAGLNISAKSSLFTFSTLAFNHLGPKLGVRRALLKVEMENISWTEGIGINPKWKDGVAITDPNQIALLKDLQPGSIRWGGIGANSKTHNFVNHVGPGRSLTYGDWIDFANELGSYAAISIAVEDGSDFMTDINTFNRFMEYINGPATTSNGALREAEGYGPLLENSKGLVIEFGNEVWGGVNHMSEIGADYEKYALWCREAANVIKSSPYYDADKVHLAISGRNVFWDKLNRETLTGDTGEVDWLAPSGYFHVDLNYSPTVDPVKSELAYYKNANSIKKAKYENMRKANAEIIGLTGETKQIYFYESNMSEPTYNGRLGQAITLIDYLLGSMKFGSAIPSLFHLTSGQWKITQPVNNYRKLAHFQAAAMVNRFCKGNVLRTDVESIDTLLSSSGKPIIFEPVGGHAFSRGENFSIVLMSRDFENDYYVQLDLPADLLIKGNPKKYVISGSDFSTYSTTIDSSEISLNNGDLILVPKHSMVLISWESNDPNFEQLPLGYYKYQKPETLTIVPDEDGFELTANKERKYFFAEVGPENTLYPYVTWEIIENDIAVTINP